MGYSITPTLAPGTNLGTSVYQKKKSPRSAAIGDILEKSKNKDMSAAKNWVFTINNYVTADEIKLDTMFDHGHFSYIIYGKEVGESGTPHLQGYVQFKKKLRLAQAKTFISSRAHMEVSRGSPEMAARYCRHFNFDITEQVRKKEILRKREFLYIVEV